LSLINDLAEVSGNLVDDLGVNDSEYQDATPPKPLAEGNYRVRAEGLELDKDKDGKVRLTGGKFPVLLVKKLTVAEGPSEGRMAAGMERVYSTTYERNGVLVDGLHDFTRSFDQTRGWRTASEGLAIAEELATNGTARVRITWEAFDKSYFDQQISALGGRHLVSKEQLKKISKDATIKGMSKFDKDTATVKGKSGDILEARTRVSMWFPSGQENVKLS
jgi:hypothetical protein